MPEIQVLRRPRQEKCCTCEVGLIYIVSFRPVTAKPCVYMLCMFLPLGSVRLSLCISSLISELSPVTVELNSTLLLCFYSIPKFCHFIDQRNYRYSCVCVCSCAQLHVPMQRPGEGVRCPPYDSIPCSLEIRSLIDPEI